MVAATLMAVGGLFVSAVIGAVRTVNAPRPVEALPLRVQVRQAAVAIAVLTAVLLASALLSA